MPAFMIRPDLIPLQSLKAKRVVNLRNALSSGSGQPHYGPSGYPELKVFTLLLLRAKTKIFAALGLEGTQ
jgi:hypothetical protein